MFVFKAAVVGAGTMGGQIAQTIAAAGFPVVLKDINQDLVQAEQLFRQALQTNPNAALLHRIFGKQNETGLTTALLDPEGLDQTIGSTDVPGLHVLTSGPIPPNPAELLHSDAFGRVLQELEKRFDRVIFDSPPLMPVTDAAVLSTRVDATVLVVKPFLTRKEVARHAARSLRDVGGRILGTVLNDLDLSRRDSSYYYQYHSRYYHAYRQETPSPSAEDGPGAAG